MKMENIEIFYMDAASFYGASADTWMFDRLTDMKRDGYSPREASKSLAGYYYWYCFPGCLPEGDAIGPFKTEEDAEKSAEERGVEK